MSDMASEFAAKGYCVAPDVFTAGEVAHLKSSIGALLQRLSATQAEPGSVPESVQGSGVFVGLAANSEVFRGVARDPRILDLLEPILGHDILFMSDKVVLKSARTVFGTPWHQDYPYWAGAHKLSVWIALDRATPENGCLKLVPGSHLSSVAHDGEVERGAGEGFVHRLDPAAVDEALAEIIPADPGTAVVFHDLTLHSSMPNTAGADRWALISTYRNANEPDLDYEWAVAAEVVRGSAHPS